MIRVLIAEDHHLVRQGIRAILEKADDIEVVAEAANGQEAVELARELAPDVVLMDIAMPRLDGSQATARVRDLEMGSQVVVLSIHAEPILVRQALQDGARGYLLKRSMTEELLLAIRAAHRGEVYLSPALCSSVVDDLMALRKGWQDGGPLEQLTEREREVLQLVCEGHTNRAIAQMLCISVSTVEKHRSSLMSKLGVHDVATLVRVAIKRGLIFLDG